MRWQESINRRGTSDGCDRGRFLPLAEAGRAGDLIRPYWPDPDAMIAELKEMGIELMVSVWPTVDYNAAENFDEMKAEGTI